MHQRISPGLAGRERLPAVAAYFLALTLLSLVAFAVRYAMAIARRKNPRTHARWMICTVFPLVTPATDRLIGAHAPQLALGVLLAYDAGTLLLHCAPAWNAFCAWFLSLPLP